MADDVKTPFAEKSKLEGPVEPPKVEEPKIEPVKVEPVVESAKEETEKVEETKVEEEEYQKILREHGGMESNIPMNSPYWKLRP